MVIVYIMGGIGNQLWQYAAGRRLAHKLGTELKLDTTYYDHDNLRPYALNLYNITAPIATPEEIARVKSSENSQGGGKFEKPHTYMPEVLNYPDNVWLHGYWQHEEYFADIADILRKEFTLRNPLGKAARRWQEKILSAECSVSLHVRHGDFAYNSPINNARPRILPLDYYYECIDRLNRQCGNLTLFVFSQNLPWLKESFKSNMSTEFISGEGLTDVEELYLMSLCKHNVIANSTFSWWGAWLNQNPDKKVFMPPRAIDADKNIPNENSLLDSDRWIRVPADFSKRPNITQRPYFSLLLVVNDDIATLNETLSRILGQDYKFYEVIIVDNCSTDGSGKLCRQAAQARDNVTLIKLWNKIPNGAAWNKALDLAQGDFVLFLKGNDRLLSNALSQMYLANEHALVDVVNSVVRLREDERGNIDLAGKKFIAEAEAAFQGLRGNMRGKFDKATLLKIFSVNGGSESLATKIFKRSFLADKGIRFDDTDDAEILFIVNAMLQAGENMFVPNVFYIAPK